MKKENWENFYTKFKKIKENTQKEIDELKMLLFDGKDEPLLHCGDTYVTASDYYKFIKNILKVSDPLFDTLGDERSFKDAGLSWLYEYHIKTKRYNDMLQLSILQYSQSHSIEQANEFIKMGWFPDDRHLDDIHKCYIVLCEEYPDLYSVDDLSPIFKV